MKHGFAIAADMWFLLAVTITRANEVLTTVSLMLACVSSLIVIVPWIVNKLKKSKGR